MSQRISVRYIEGKKGGFLYLELMPLLDSFLDKAIFNDAFLLVTMT